MQALEYVKPGMTKSGSVESLPGAPRGEGEDDPMQWTTKLVSDLPDLRAPITVNVDTTCWKMLVDEGDLVHEEGWLEYVVCQ